MINLKDVKKHYGDFSLDCTMSVSAGSVTGLIGPNKSGKTTIFKAILNLINIEDGQIQIFSEGHYENSLLKKNDIGVFFKDSGFSENLSVKKIANILDGFYEDFQREKFLEQCKAMDFPLNKKIEGFSREMKVKLHIVIAMSYNPQLLLLDEPLDGLDAVSCSEVLHLLSSFMESGQKSIIVSSQSAADIESICNDIYLINQGKIIFHEFINNIRNHYSILRLDNEQFRNINKEFLMKISRENYGFVCLTNEKGFYEKNYKDIIIEQCSVDMILNMLGGDF